MIGENFQIYSVQITGKCILWNSFPLGMIWSLVLPHKTIPPQIFPTKCVPYKKKFLQKSTLLGDAISSIQKKHLLWNLTKWLVQK